MNVGVGVGDMIDMQYERIVRGGRGGEGIQRSGSKVISKIS